MDILKDIPEPARTTITTGLLVWAAIALFTLYVFRDRYCHKCGGRLRFRERFMDSQGYDLCDRHQRFSHPKEDDDDYTDNPHI